MCHRCMMYALVVRHDMIQPGWVMSEHRAGLQTCPLFLSISEDLQELSFAEVFFQTGQFKTARSLNNPWGTLT